MEPILRLLRQPVNKDKENWSLYSKNRSQKLSLKKLQLKFNRHLLDVQNLLNK